MKWYWWQHCTIIKGTFFFCSYCSVHCKVWVQGCLFIQPKFQKFWLESKWNRPLLFNLARIFDNTFQGGPLWAVLLVWLKLPFPFDIIIVVPAPTHLYPSYKHLPKHTLAWVRSVQLECIVPLGVWNFQNFKQEFCWTERTIKLDVVGLHLLCLGLTRDFNKNNLKNVPLKALYCVFVVQGYTQSTMYISRAVIERRGPKISPGYPKHSHTHEKISIVIVTWEITPCAAVSLTAVPLSK